MAKNIKLNIKNTQIAKAINLDSVKDKLEKKKAQPKAKDDLQEAKKSIELEKSEHFDEEQIEETPRIKARSRSAFAPKEQEEKKREAIEEESQDSIHIEKEIEQPIHLKEEGVKEEEKEKANKSPTESYERLGPTGRHINDLLPAKKPIIEKPEIKKETTQESKISKTKPKQDPVKEQETQEKDEAKKGKTTRFKEFKDVKPAKKQTEARSFDARDRHGFRDIEESSHWRKKRAKQKFNKDDTTTVRPKALHLRLPISIKDFASEMKLKASQLISKLFMQGMVLTLNDYLEDETVIQLLGHEFDCDITIDTSAEQRLRITDQSIKDEIKKTDPAELETRPPVVTFMGHVDHGKTSLIDFIRSSNRVAGEAGAITQHIGAFRCHTSIGDIAILDTPGHEAFSAMRSRGADVTDIVVLVVAGDEGIKEQTVEAIEHAKSANVTIIVAINKCDKPNFNSQNVYRELSEKGLLSEAWGGQTITVNCSAVTGEGVNELLEMLALQAEVLELKANSHTRARGSVLESEMHKGLGCVATVFVQNGRLNLGDALVFGEHWGKVKTMRDERGDNIKEALPSTPVEITGLSGLPEAGQEFIVVKNEKEARDIATLRMTEFKQKRQLQSKRFTMEALIEEAEISKKYLNVILRTDVQGSLEALQTILEKIKSKKVQLNILSAEVGEVTESDIQLASPANAVVIGFHTQVESHAEELIKQLGVQIRLYDVIYHAADEVKELMTEQLDKLEQENEKGKAEVRATFKSSHLGVIAGCYVTEGSIHRNHRARLVRDGVIIWKGSVSSLKRVKDDVREVQKGLECGIVLPNFNEIEVGDFIETYDITYLKQQL